MAIYFPNSNSLLLLPPKTGTTWIRETLLQANVFHVVLGPESLNGHGRLALYGRDFRCVAAFIRHPVMWYHSYWRYRSSSQSEWDERWHIDADCQSDNFEKFIDRVTQLHPGYLTNMFEEFTGQPNNTIEFVGKMETLRADMLKLLSGLGERFDEATIINTPPLNVSGKKYVPSQTVFEKVFESEQEIYGRYGYNIRPT